MSEAICHDNKAMRRDFADRTALITYLLEAFPEATNISAEVSDTVGSRAAAEARLADIDSVAYATSRNYLNGAVSRLSPYLRHGVIGLAEVKAVIKAVSADSAPSKFIQELGWRDHFQRVYAEIGSAIWQDREPYKTGFAADDYAGCVAKISEPRSPDTLRLGEQRCLLHQTKQSVNELFLGHVI